MMKTVTVIAIILILGHSTADAQLRGGGSDWFDLVLSYADESTAADLIADRDTIDALRDELLLLRSAEETDQDAIDAVIIELQALRDTTRDQLGEIVEGNEDLQAELRDSTRSARVRFLSGNGSFGNGNLLDEILAASTDEQAASFQANQESLDALLAELQSAREAGAGTDELSDILAEYSALRETQRDLIADIVAENEDALASVFADANEARQAARENAGAFGTGRGRPAGVGRGRGGPNGG